MKLRWCSLRMSIWVCVYSAAPVTGAVHNDGGTLMNGKLRVGFAVIAVVVLAASTALAGPYLENFDSYTAGRFQTWSPSAVRILWKPLA